MVVIKNLNYKQFAFLLSMAGVTGYQESSDNESDSSSEITESDTETDSNDGETRDSVEQLSDGKSSESDNSATPVASSCSSSGNNSSSSKNQALPKKESAAVSKLEVDWVSDEDEEKVPRKQTTFSSTPKKDFDVRLGTVAPAPTIDFPDLNKTDDEGEERKIMNEVLNDLDKVCSIEGESKDASVLSNCDSNSNATTPDISLSHPLYSEEVVEDIKVSNLDESKDSLKVSNLLNDSATADDETKSFEFHLFEPPDPMKNDNQTIDSGSESDKEDSGIFPRRTRRVNFTDTLPLSPLMIDIDNILPSNSIDYADSGSISTTIEEKLLGKSSYNGADPSNNILKRLLSSSPPLHGDEGLKSLGLGILKSNDVKTDLLSNSKESHHTVDMIGMYGEVENNNDTTTGRSVDFIQNILGPKPDDRLRLRRSLSPGGSDNRVADGRRSMSLGGSPQLTPTGSDVSGDLPVDNLSDSGIQSRNDVISSRDDEINKTHDSDSPTTPSSVVSTETCNMSGETLECHSDSEERFRNLDDDLKNDREKRNLTDDEEESNEVTVPGNLQAFFNLNNLGEVSIKIITLDDVLGVISRTKRSVTDEEIKKYTDFMVWFADVAKSACPHNSKGSNADSSSVAGESRASSSWDDTPQYYKKRKGPLHKLGHFLLKALMLLLD